MGTSVALTLILYSTRRESRLRSFGSETIAATDLPRSASVIACAIAAVSVGNPTRNSSMTGR